MSRCTRVGHNHRVICAGDLNRQIILQDRNITAPIWGSVDFDETFSGDATVWAKVDTVTGKTFFDSVNQRDTTITHQIYIRYDSTVTAETWVQLDGRRLDILAVENLDERNEWLKLTCVDKGTSKV